MENRISDRQLRCENALHPGSHAQGGLVWHDSIAAAKNGAMASRNMSFLLKQNDMGASRWRWREEGQESPRLELLKGPLRIKQLYFARAQRLSAQHACRVDD